MQDYPEWIVRGERILDGLSKLCVFVASCALVVLVATFGWLVFGRYVLNATPTWVEQLALLLVCYIAYLGAAAGVHERTHLGVTLFRDMMGPKVSAYLKLFNDIVLAAFGGLMAVASLELFQFGWSTLLPMLNIPESFRTLSALLCGGLVCIFAGFRALFRLALMMRGQTYYEEEAV
ncbi:TRAP-type C4-dicarboxylate transport system permease small subunit [Shimia isoporae]|uniref:TRAP transporter small permease protein n=1 Tax=Shimia isoporae TaxID=647720 RepID=A0A4R1N4X2_9RHOB|nr:TRAP transporter small permease [Shimia isoporae]TCL00775.1 TRAP-type C4-dicarboxylate transport system permease small subunit [Shimia isoporae]